MYEKEDDLIHVRERGWSDSCTRKMLMEAINGGHWKTAYLPTTPTKVLLAPHLVFRAEIKMSRWALIFKRISQPCLTILDGKKNIRLLVSWTTQKYWCSIWDLFVNWAKVVWDRKQDERRWHVWEWKILEFFQWPDKIVLFWNSNSQKWVSIFNKPTHSSSIKCFTWKLVALLESLKAQWAHCLQWLSLSAELEMLAQL